MWEHFQIIFRKLLKYFSKIGETRTTILYMCWIFHTYIIFSSFYFSHLNIFQKSAKCEILPTFKWWKKYEGKKLWLWKMPKNRKNYFGNIFKIFSENCWNIFRKSAKCGRKTPIFEKYFKNVPKIIFSIFWHFYTRPAILYVWKKFHNHNFFPSYFFHHLKIGGRWHISYRLLVLGNVTHMEDGGSLYKPHVVI